MNNGQIYTDKRDYVSALKAVLEPIQDFLDLMYARSYVTEEEYLKISDQLGNAAFLDVTGMTKAEMLKEVARVILLDEIQGQFAPKSVVADIETKRKIAPLFR